MPHLPTVLLVDDDPDIRDLLMITFRSHGGFEVAGMAADGFEGAVMAAELSPDIVILDHLMPRWDGQEAARFIRRHLPDTKIIAFSAALAERPDWADGFLTKTDIGRLVPLIREMWDAV